MRHVAVVLGVSERRACRVIGQARSSQRYRPRKREPDARIEARLHALSQAHPRYGYRRITALLRREGWLVNAKRVQRLWQQAGLQVPPPEKRRKRISEPAGQNSTVKLKPMHPNHVWTYDFVQETTQDGRRFRVLTVLDEYTRECLALVAARSITSSRVRAELARLIAQRGAPVNVRSDNGPEFIAEAVKTYLSETGSRTCFIDPGSPWQNAYIESFNGKLRDEFLSREAFASVAEAQVLAEGHRRHYNRERPHSGLDYLTPEAFAARHCTLLNPARILT